MSQTSITYPLQRAIAGLLADTGYGYDIDNGFNADTTNLAFGLVVMKGGADNDCLAFTNGAVPVGVLIHSHSYDNGPNGTLDTMTVQSGSVVGPGLKPKACFSLLRRGRIWVQVEEAVNQYDRAWVRYATGTGGTANMPLGGFRKSQDPGNTSATNSYIKNFQYLNSAGAGGYAIVDVDMLLS